MKFKSKTHLKLMEHNKKVLKDFLEKGDFNL